MKVKKLLYRKGKNRVKDLIIVIVILLLVFIPGYFVKNYLENSGNKIVERLEMLEDSVYYGNFESIETIYSIKKDWETTENVWNVLSNHQNTDEIQREFEKLVANYKMANINATLINITEIKSMIEDTPRGEAFSLVNIF